MKRFLSVFLVILLFASLLPAAYADAVPMSKIYIKTYNDTGSGNDVPRVGQSVSTFTAQPESAGFIISSLSLYDMNGAQCTGTVLDQQYVLYVNISVVDGNYYIDGSSTAFINGVQCSITPGGDGKSAVISRNVTPKVVDPTIWKHPGDENHDKSKVFSFAASASPYYNNWQWYILSTYGDKMTADEFAAAYPSVGVAYHENSGGGVTLNINNPIDEMDGWLVYCGFQSLSGAWVYTNKAQMKIKGAVVTTPTIVAPPEEEKTTTVVDGIEVPEGVTIVETPGPEITIVETPEPTVEPTPTPEVKPEKSGTGLKILKGVGIAVGGIVIIGGIIIFAQYLADRKKRKRRAKMSGRKYTGKH